MGRTPPLCDSCRDAIWEEASSFGFRTEEELAFIAAEFGGLISDHGCLMLQQDGDDECCCGCYPDEKRHRRALSRAKKGQ